ncbi:hypothetical protein GCM10023336_05480 [Streptomyces similanensis]|uniref:Uncharacterized protein n=1 Tax=Streptomyces similanensis TaxID=1274988 RepID=A0ABP9JW72_9ACTN
MDRRHKVLTCSRSRQTGAPSEGHLVGGGAAHPRGPLALPSIAPTDDTEHFGSRLPPPASSGGPKYVRALLR